MSSELTASERRRIEKALNEITERLEDIDGLITVLLRLKPCPDCLKPFSESGRRGCPNRRFHKAPVSKCSGSLAEEDRP